MGSFPGTKHETDLSLPSNAEVKNPWSYISIPLHALMACCVDTETTVPYLTFTDELCTYNM